MSEIKFTCPKCKQSLEGDDSMRGQVVQCPSCNTDITVPVAPQKKQIILPKAGASGGSSAYTPPPKPKTSKVGIVVALIVGLGIGYGVGSAKGPSLITKFGSGDGLSLPSFGRQTKEEWMEKVKRNQFYNDYQRQILGIKKDAFVKVMGKPAKTQAVGKQLMWYFECSDGQIQMVINKAMMDIAGEINTEMINEY